MPLATTILGKDSWCEALPKVADARNGKDILVATEARFLTRDFGYCEIGSIPIMGVFLLKVQ